MPRKFTPADRSDVLEMVRERSFVHNATALGEGIQAVQKASAYGPHNFTAIVEDFGWYVASYEASDGGDRVIFMPITEVSTDG